jgi:hypothetical protein
MDKGNIFHFPTDQQCYVVVHINGETQLALWNKDHWELDDTCNSVNELVRAGLVSEDALQMWIRKSA